MGNSDLATTRQLLRSLLMSDVFAGSAAALVIKFIASVLGFVMFALAARQMATAEFGALAVIFNAMSFLSVAAVLGQETLIARSWGEYCGSDRPALARGAFAFGARVVLISAFTAAVATATVWLTWGEPETSWLPIAASTFLFAQALMTFNARFTLVSAGVFAAEIPRDIVWRSVVVAVILVHVAIGFDFLTTEFFVTASCAVLLSLVYQAWRVSGATPEAVKQAKPQFETASWSRRSVGMWLSSLLDTSSQYLEVIVVGFFLGPVAAAFYFSATRITNVFAMIAGGVTTYATTHISKLFHASAKDELQNVLRSLAIISALLCVGAFVTILAAGKLLLSFYGAPYVDIYPVLLVLAFGASLTALAGPAPYLLLLTGHERTYPRVMGAGLLLKIALIAILGHWFGLMGAAIAGSAAAAFTAIALVIACRRAIGMDPSFLSALARKEPLEGWTKASSRWIA